MKLTLDKRKGESENSIKYHTKVRLTVVTTSHKGWENVEDNKEAKRNKREGIWEIYREEQNFLNSLKRRRGQHKRQILWHKENFKQATKTHTDVKT